MRVKFKKGMQREFLKKVIIKLNSPSLRGLLQFGFDVNYQTLKSYFLEHRLLPKDLFLDLCYLAKINSDDLNVEYLEDNWGRVLGGKLGKR